MHLAFSEVRLCLGDIPEYDRAFRFYAAIMDVQAECKRLWAYLRWLDKAGSGCAVIQVSIAARFLKCSKQTIYRMLALGLTPTPTVPRKGDERPSVVGTPLRWFRDRISCGGGVIKVWYSSAVVVCEGLGLHSPGAISDVPIDALSRVGAKIAATELTTLHRQRQAHYAARSAKGNKGYKIIRPWDATPSEISSGVSGLLCKAGEIIPGISIKGITKAADWSRFTIRRRLDNKYRKDKGFDPIGKSRIYTRAPEMDAYLRSCAHYTSVVVEDGRTYKLLHDCAFLLGTNAYQEEYRLLSCRHLRSRCWTAFKGPVDVARSIRTNTQNLLKVAGASETAFPDSIS
jgi:hypothetical protein